MERTTVAEPALPAATLIRLPNELTLLDALPNELVSWLRFVSETGISL